MLSTSTWALATAVSASSTCVLPSTRRGETLTFKMSQIYPNTPNAGLCKASLKLQTLATWTAVSTLLTVTFLSGVDVAAGVGSLNTITWIFWIVVHQKCHWPTSFFWPRRSWPSEPTWYGKNWLEHSEEEVQTRKFWKFVAKILTWIPTDFYQTNLDLEFSE